MLFYNFFILVINLLLVNMKIVYFEIYQTGNVKLWKKKKKKEFDSSTVL